MWADGLGDSQGQVVDDDDDGQVAGDLHHGTGVQIGGKLQGHVVVQGPWVDELHGSC